MITITDQHKPQLSRMGVLAREMMDIKNWLKDNELPESRIKELQLALAEKTQAYELEKALVFKK